MTNRYSLKSDYITSKSIDLVLGARIHGCRNVRIDESTELWWPQGVIKLIVSTKYSDEGEERFHLFDGLLQSLTNADFKK